MKRSANRFFKFKEFLPKLAQTLCQFLVFLSIFGTISVAQNTVLEDSFVEMPKKPEKFLYSQKNYQSGSQAEDKAKNSQQNANNQPKENSKWKCEILSTETKAKIPFSNSSDNQFIKKCSDDEIICIFQPSGLNAQINSVCFKKN